MFKNQQSQATIQRHSAHTAFRPQKITTAMLCFLNIIQTNRWVHGILLFSIGIGLIFFGVRCENSSIYVLPSNEYREWYEENEEPMYKKILIIMPYRPAQFRDWKRSYTGFDPIPPRDEDYIYESIVQSLKDAHFFEEVSVAETEEVAWGMEGHVYLWIMNLSFTMQQVSSEQWDLIYRTHFIVGVKNKTYFEKIYEIRKENWKSGQASVVGKIQIMEELVNLFFRDIETSKGNWM